MMKLFEDYKNLNILDRTLLHKYRGGEVIPLKNAPITPNSEIYIERVTPHNFTNAMSMLEDESIAALVFRAHNKQLIMVTKNSELIKKYGYYNEYMAVLTNYAYQKCNDHYGTQFIRSDREAPIKTAVSRIIKTFYDKAPEGTKKKWDVLVVKVDPNVEQLQMNRANAQQGSVPTPSDAGYDRFIEKLNNDFQQRAKEFIDSRRPDHQNINDIAQMMTTQTKWNKIKVRGIVYQLYDTQIYIGNDENNMSYLQYRAIDGLNVPDKQRQLYVFFRFQGFTPVFIKAVPCDTWTNPRMAQNDIGNSSISF